MRLSELDTIIRKGWGPETHPRPFPRYVPPAEIMKSDKSADPVTDNSQVNISQARLPLVKHNIDPSRSGIELGHDFHGLSQELITGFCHQREV